ncbi:GNAT family N-acetyltransferase [Fulvivirgaceae bacterium PWU4]|uniref:GNAT family N-acetyltransferase n=1 Tax=Chryseosolibacter histidini TaxID=2782349 RepID=A0AAP2GH04_9BACT|nr:GNAT family N-acetyltransferase [Chryseosolibacter histidini]MBT1695511.1 GNAT family N-acetyltransferase [Chryseosolibacter histidini]
MIIKASIQHASVLSELGAETFYASHQHSAPANQLAAYMKKVYSLEAIEKELADPVNIYHIIMHNDTVAGFSKMELTIKHPAIEPDRISKMDQIYLLDSFHGLKLGAELLSHNIDYSKANGQNGMWLVVWVGNTTAIAFYEKFGFRIVAKDDFQLTETHLSPCYIMLLAYASNNKIS